MPTTGTATYTGEMRTERWNEDSPASRTQRTDGDLTLTANFGDATIAGNVNCNNSPVLTFIEGKIQNSEFNARFSGEERLEGFTGNVRGAFFGPAAEEVGGVLDGSHTGGDLLVGYIGGRKQ